MSSRFELTGEGVPVNLVAAYYAPVSGSQPQHTDERGVLEKLGHMFEQIPTNEGMPVRACRRKRTD